MGGWATLAAVVLVGVVSGASAQGGAQELEGWAHQDSMPPSLADRGSFSRSDWGDFDGDRRPDAVLLEGDRAVVLFAPDMTFAPVAIPGEHRGLCALRDTAAPQHSLALSGAAGVKVLSFDVMTQDFVGAQVLAGSFAGARELRAADLDGDGVRELLAISADRSCVLVAQRAGSTWSHVATRSSTGAARDVVALQWDSDAALELALLSDQGVSVWDDNGVLLSNHVATLAGGAIARVQQAGQSFDRLAWISAYAPPEIQWLRTLSPNGAVESVDLGNLGAYAAVGADFDGDADSDLLVAPRHGEALLWLENQRNPGQPNGVTFSIEPQAVRVFEWHDAAAGSAPTVQDAWPAVADFDLDGDFDFVIGVESTRRVLTRFGDWVDEGSQRARLVSAYYDTTEMELRVTVAPPEVTSIAATHWIVDVWRAPNIDSPLAAQAVETYEVAAPSGPSAVLTIALDEATAVFHAVYRVRVLPAQRNVLGELVASGCPTQFAFAVREEAAAELEQEYGVEAVVEAGAALPENTGARPKVTRGQRTISFPAGSPPTSSPLN
jgi:hypothetical protein